MIKLSRTGKALLAAFALEIALLVLGFALAAWVGSSLFGGSLSASAGFQVIVAILVAVLFLPAFVAGYLARERGFVFGLILGLLPVAMAALSVFAGGAVILLAVYLLFSGLSGLGGAAFARWRHAP
jgi:hypothetical protein